MCFLPFLRLLMILDPIKTSPVFEGECVRVCLSHLADTN